MTQPKPFKSWIINEETGEWESPIGPAPNDEEPRAFYRWIEELYDLDNTKGWVLLTPEPPPAE